MDSKTEKFENLKDILLKDENDDTKFSKFVDALRSLLHSPEEKELVDVSAISGGLRAMILEDGVTVEFKVIEAGQTETDETDEEQTSDSSSKFTRYRTDYTENEKIGKGAFGHVYQCTHKLDKREYVIKMVPFKEEDREKTLREVEALGMLQHKNVVRYYQCWIEDGAIAAGSSYSSSSSDSPDTTLFIAMEYCPRTLKEMLDVPLENEKIYEFCKQLLEGLSYIHQKGIVHLDIKPDNIFIDYSGNLKIGDFGYAVISESREWGADTSSLMGGDVLYEAPELKSSLSFSEKVDCYSIGLVLLEMLSSPISTVSEKIELFQKVRCSILPDVEDKKIQAMLRALLEEDSTSHQQFSEVKKISQTSKTQLKKQKKKL